MPLIDENKPYFKPLNGEKHRTTVLGAGILTYNVPRQCNCVAVQALTQNIRFTLDGTNPTASSGFQLKAGNPAIKIEMADTVTLKFIREAAGAVLELQAGA